MERAGVIAEYNPFHNGHAAQLALVRERGARSIAVVLSGCFVQRGGPALFSETVRAQAALRCGADLVAELPVAWAAAEADRFAAGGVALLAAMGCDTLCFGAEDPDPGRLWALARLLEEPAFDAALKARHAAGGGSLAALRATLAEERLPGAAALLAGPNNSLGVAYLRAILRLGLPMEALPLPRLQAAHDAPLPGGGAYASAAALRGALAAAGAEGGLPALQRLAGYLPAAALPLYRQAVEAGAVLDPRAFSLSLLSLLRAAGPGAFARLPGGGGEGLCGLLAAAAAEATDAEGLYARMKSKRYTHARLRRLALAAYLGLEEPLPALPPYLRLLGGSDAGLRGLPKAAGPAVPPLVRCSSLAKLCRAGGEAGRTARLEARAGALWALCLRTPRPAGELFTARFLRP